MNSSILKIAGEDALQQNIVETKEYVNARTGVWTTPVSCLTGDTSVTITDAAIKPTSYIDSVLAQTASGEGVGFKKIEVPTSGQAVVTFSKPLTEATSVVMHVINL
jgi:hypothetical protein